VGKGRRRVGTSEKTITVTTRAAKKNSTEGTESGGGGEGGQQSQDCWTFPLEKPDKAKIREVGVGTKVQGQFVGTELLVISPQHGALGRAPAGLGREILKAQQNKGGSLGGEVVEHLKTTVKVKLCLQ
jgi:hypothetical protein